MNNKRINLFVTVGLIFSIFSCNNVSKNSVEQNLKEVEYDNKGFILPVDSEMPEVKQLYKDLTYAFFYYESKEKQERLCDKIIELDSTFAQAYFFKAYFSEPPNMDLIDKGYRLSKKSSEVMRLMCAADYAGFVEHDNAKAIKLFTKVEDLYPKSKEATWCVGMAYMWNNEMHKAVEQFTKTLRIDPDFPKANEYLARAYFSLGNMEEAQINFEKVLSYELHETGSYADLFKIYEQNGQTEKILNILKDKIGNKLNSPYWYTYYIFILKKQGHAQEAEKFSKPKFTGYSIETYPVTIQVKVPNESDEVYISGIQPNLKMWNPNGVKLKRKSTYIREISLNCHSPMEFNFNRDRTWKTEAVIQGNKDFSKLKADLGLKSNILKYEIEGWKDE